MDAKSDEDRLVDETHGGALRKLEVNLDKIKEQPEHMLQSGEPSTRTENVKSLLADYSMSKRVDSNENSALVSPRARLSSK